MSDVAARCSSEGTRELRSVPRLVGQTRGREKDSGRSTPTRFVAYGLMEFSQSFQNMFLSFVISCASLFAIQ